MCVIYGNDVHSKTHTTGTWNDAKDTDNADAYVCSYRFACEQGFRLEPIHEKRCYAVLTPSAEAS